MKSDQYTVSDRNGKPTTYDRFKCTYMRVEDGKIVALNIENAKTRKTVYVFGDVLPDYTCCVCGKAVTKAIADGSKAANDGKIYCSGTCKKNDHART